uniref:Uncharacterized protein n=1 Tax=viral metagenome TaxID=1070528 RepID=A0A6C0EUS2_9ZZZZ
MSIEYIYIDDISHNNYIHSHKIHIYLFFIK